VITLEQLEALLGAGDVSEQEKQRQQLLQLGVNLRGNMSNVQGRGVGSNLGRAAYGVGGALSDYRAGKMSPEITKTKQDLYARIMRSMNPKRPSTDPAELPYGSFDEL
jgi:hypothetical protein